MKPSFSLLRAVFTVCGAVLLFATARAEMRVFTDVEGRTLQAEITAATDTAIQVKLKNGKQAEIPLERLVDADRLFIIGWKEQRAKDAEAMAAAEAAKKRAEEIPVKLVAFCRENLGKQVGNGECWTLANEAFRACGLKRPGGQLRVWGRLIDLKTEKLQAGDIAEYRSAKFSNGTWTGPEHTSVVVEAKRDSIVVAQQNWAGKKTVSEMEFDPETLVSGELMFYRPE